MLLLYFIHDYVFAPSLSKFVVNETSRNGCEQKEVEEDEDNKEDIIWLIILDSKNLVIRVEVISADRIYLIYHLS